MVSLGKSHNSLLWLLNYDNNEHIDKSKQEEEEEETKTMTTKINKEEKEDEVEEELNTNLTSMRHIAFLQLTSGAHVTVSKYGFSWNDRRQPVFAVTSLFTRFNFVARLSRYLRY